MSDNKQNSNEQAVVGVPAVSEISGVENVKEKIFVEPQESKELEIKNKELILRKEIDLLEEEKRKLEVERERINKKKLECAKQQKTLSEKERDISDRELNAAAGFELQNKNSLKILEEKKEQLKKEIQEEDNKLQKYKKEELDKIAEFLVQQRKERFDKLQSDIDKQRKQLEIELEKRKSNSEKYYAEKEDRIKSREDEVTKQKKKIMEEEQKLDKKANELKFKEMELDNKEKMLDEDKKNIKYEIEERVKENSINSKRKINSMEQIIEELNDTIITLEDKINNFEKINKNFGHKTPGQVLQDLKEKDNKITELNKDLLNRPSINILTEYNELKKQNSKLIEKNRKSIKEVGALKTDQANWLVSVSELDNQRNLKEIAEHKTEAIKAQIEKYSEEVNKLRSLYEQPKEIEARIGVIKEPYFEIKTINSNTEINELEWLENIHNNCVDSGLRFNKRLLFAFHTALKTSEWSPMTVLAGVSGTGKSELPRLYSRFGGLYFLPLPVQPDWDSPQSLFGFFNSIDNRFNATPLLRTLVQSQNDNEEVLNTKTNKMENNQGLADHLLLVLLDEMNLAHVELYFSELLSKLETRRGDKNGVNLEIDLGAGLDKYKVNLGRNILWTGTMNEDETTKSLSDKVLDRGNLISFPRPKSFERRLKLDLANESKMLQKKVWENWIITKVDFDDEIDEYKIGLEEINGYLEEAGRALGHRVWQSVENYMANHPLLIQASQDTEDTDGKNYEKFMRIAFEDALVHKVMPKLRGIEADGSSKEKCLIPIGNKINEIAPGLYEDYQLAMTSSQGVFVWRSARYLENGDV